MITISTDALKWLFNHLRPRWFWVSVAVLGAGFSVWSTIPEKYRSHIIDYAVERARGPSEKIDLEVGAFEITGETAEDLVWLKNKIERNLVELFVTKNTKTAHQLTVLKADAGQHPRITGQISRSPGDLVEISARLLDPKGVVLASTSFEAPLSFLKDNYKALPHTIVYGLDIGYTSLAPLNSKARATASLPAYAVFLMARDAARRERYEDALKLLDQATVLDPKFATAHEAAADVLKVLKRAEDAAARLAKADEINLDRAKVPFLQGAAKPLPAVVRALSKATWKTVVPGLKLQDVVISDYNIRIASWQIDPKKFSMQVVLQDSPQGSAVRDVRERSGAVLAINGGFFDIDREGRLTPSGYVVANGREAGTYRKGAGSGVLYENPDGLQIGWSKDVAGLHGVRHAVQAGPMVVDPGGKNGIYANDFNRHDRTAVCVTAEGAVVVVIVKGGLSLFELGTILSNDELTGGFGCERAINLDGGPSTQVSFSHGNKSIELEATWRTQNVVVFKPR